MAYRPGLPALMGALALAGVITITALPPVHAIPQYALAPDDYGHDHPEPKDRTPVREFRLAAPSTSNVARPVNYDDMRVLIESIKRSI
jgi:hypothetical protein